jgi:hypothetical protein
MDLGRPQPPEMLEDQNADERDVHTPQRSQLVNSNYCSHDHPDETDQAEPSQVPTARDERRSARHGNVQQRDEGVIWGVRRVLDATSLLALRLDTP